jgi:hypothetical protein
MAIGNGIDTRQVSLFLLGRSGVRVEALTHFLLWLRSHTADVPPSNRKISMLQHSPRARVRVLGDIQWQETNIDRPPSQYYLHHFKQLVISFVLVTTLLRQVRPSDLPGKASPAYQRRKSDLQIINLTINRPVLDHVRVFLSSTSINCHFRHAYTALCCSALDSIKRLERTSMSMELRASHGSKHYINKMIRILI